MHPIAKMRIYAARNGFPIDPVWRLNISPAANRAADEFMSREVSPAETLSETEVDSGAAGRYDAGADVSEDGGHLGAR